MTSFGLTLPRTTGDGPMPTPVWWPISVPAAQLSALGHRECVRLLGRTGTGQLSFRGAGGTAALDVDYEITEATAILGPLPAAAQQAMAAPQLILFRVDHADLAQRWGWSVVLVDAAHPATYVEVGLTSLAGRRISAAYR